MSAVLNKILSFLLIWFHLFAKHLENEKAEKHKAADENDNITLILEKTMVEDDVQPKKLPWYVKIWRRLKNFLSYLYRIEK